MSLLRSLFGRSVSIGTPSIVPLLGGLQPTAAGIHVSEESALRQMAVWRAVNLTAGTVADLPIEVYRNLSDGGQREIDSPFFRGEAYPDLTWPEFIETQMLHLLLNGNAYALKVLNEAGDRVVRLLPLDPQTVGVERGTPTPTNPSGKLYRIDGSQEPPLTPNEIMHVPGLSYDGLIGLSPIAAARESIATSLAAERVAGGLFDSGLLMGGILHAEMEMTDEDAEQVKRNWREKVAGVTRAHEIAIVSNGLTFTPAQHPPKDAQWLESREFGVQEIARLYGVPADLLMENSNTGNTDVEQRALFWVKFGLRHWVKRLESRYSQHLLPRGQVVKFNMDALLRGDSETQATVFSKAIRSHYLTVNEVRDILRLPPVAWGDEPVPTHITQSESADVEPADVPGGEE